MNDLDTALRTMLLERAQDITELPAALADLDLGGSTTSTPAGPEREIRRDRGNVRHLRQDDHSRRTTWLIAASVAAVLAVGGVVTAVSLHGHDKHGTNPNPPVSHSVTHTPSPTPNPSHTRTTTNQSAPQATARGVCTTSEPEAWRTAFGTTQSYGAQSATPLAVDGSDLVVTRDFGSSRDVAVVSPDGNVKHVYDVPDPDQNQVLSAAADGSHLVIPVSHLPRNANGVLPSIVRLEVIDLGTGHATTITTAPIIIRNGLQGRTVEAATIFRATVYYNDIPTYVSTTSTIHAYDIATGRTTSVHTQQASHGDGPLVKAGGLYWSQQDTSPAIAANVPASVTRLLTTARAQRSLITNGTEYAFNIAGNQVGYWRPGMSKPTVYSTGAIKGYPSGVADHVVVFAGHAIDTRSGALTALATLPGLTFSTPTMIAATNGDPTVPMKVVDVASLPELRC